MVTEIKNFSSLGGFMDYIEGEVKAVKDKLEKYVNDLNIVRTKIESLDKFSNFISKLIGKESKFSSQQEIDFMGLKLIINPSPHYEASILEEIIRKLNEKLISLQKIKKAIESLEVHKIIDAQIQVVIIDDIPARLMLKI